MDPHIEMQPLDWNSRCVIVYCSKRSVAPSARCLLPSVFCLREEHEGERIPGHVPGNGREIAFVQPADLRTTISEIKTTARQNPAKPCHCSFGLAGPDGRNLRKNPPWDDRNTRNYSKLPQMHNTNLAPSQIIDSALTSCKRNSGEMNIGMIGNL